MIAPDVDEERIEEGERFAQSPITGATYRVTRWVEVGDGRIVAIEKERIEEDVDR
jgi:sugar lactone lactonase YvrE